MVIIFWGETKALTECSSRIERINREGWWSSIFRMRDCCLKSILVITIECFVYAVCVVCCL